MKEFNLELAKAGHPVQTRGGKPARIICFDMKNTFPIVALLQLFGDGVECLMFYNNKGLGLNEKSDIDLVMAQTKKEGWVNIYKSFAGTRYCGNIYSSEEEAINHTNDYGDTHLTTTKIEWEE